MNLEKLSNCAYIIASTATASGLMFFTGNTIKNYPIPIVSGVIAGVSYSIAKYSENRLEKQKVKQGLEAKI